MTRSVRRCRVVALVLLTLALLLPQAVFAAPSPDGQVPVQLPQAAAPSLAQGVWLWNRTEYNDDSVLQSPNPNAYTLAFMSDGRLAIQADCNTGSATYTVNGSSLTIGLGVMTLAACAPGSQDGPFLRDLAQVATYVFDGPQLVLNIRLDTGNMIFSPQSLTGLCIDRGRVRPALPYE